MFRLVVRTASMLALAAPLMAQYVIDDFTAGDGFSLGRDPAQYGYDPIDYPGWIPVPVPGMGSTSTFDPGTIMGGHRDVTFDHSVGYQGSPTVDYNPGYGISFNSAWDYAIAFWTITYGGQIDLNADFTSCGNDRIVLHMSGQIDVDANGDDTGVHGHDATPSMLTVWSHGQSESVTKDLYSNPNYLNQQYEIDWTYLFSEFSTTDWTAVDRIEIRFEYFEQNHAVDYSVRGISLPDACGDDLVVEAEEQPGSFALAQNHPNPFNPGTSISYNLAETGMASLQVFDMAGRSVAKLFDGLQEAGQHSVYFDASGLSSGVYVYTLSVDGVHETKKMVLLK